MEKFKNVCFLIIVIGFCLVHSAEIRQKNRVAELMHTVHKREVEEKSPEIFQNPCTVSENGHIICISVNNIISVPNQCPNGTQADSLGNCRPVLP